MNTDLSRAKSHSFLSCDAENITLEALKQAEDGNGVIIRLAEQHNKSGTVTIDFDRPIEKAWVCDLMENIESEIQSSGKQLSLKVEPYEIVTLRVCLGEFGLEPTHS